MSLAERLTAPPSRRVYEMLLDQHLARMSDEDREATLDALRGPLWSNAQLAHVLTQQGYRISPAAVRNWRIRETR